MATADNTTQLPAAQKKCPTCGHEKSLLSFSLDKSKKDGYRAQCKSCTSKAGLAYRRSPETRASYQESYTKSAKRRADERQKRTGKRSWSSPEYRRAQRLRAKGYSKEEAIKLASILRAAQQKNRVEDKAYDALAKANARQAWRYWLNHLASDLWMEAYFKDKPWNNPRLSQAEKWRVKYQKNPEFQLHQRMRAHMRRRKRHDKIGDLMRLALKANRQSNRVESLLGYTIADLKKSLEKQFTRGMTWEKFASGQIHIDHIVPISAFSFTGIDDPEWRACWCLTNLRPAWAKDNLEKGSKIKFLI